jgi:hypothetical protein
LGEATLRRRQIPAGSGQVGARDSGSGGVDRGVECGAGGEAGGQLGLDREHRRGGPRPDVLGHLLARQQRHAADQGAGGEVLGQLATHGGLGHDARGGDHPLGLAAQIGGVPGRAAAASRVSTWSTARSRFTAPTGAGRSSTGALGAR